MNEQVMNYFFERFNENLNEKVANFNTLIDTGYGEKLTEIIDEVGIENFCANFDAFCKEAGLKDKLKKGVAIGALTAGSMVAGDSLGHTMRDNKKATQELRQTELSNAEQTGKNKARAAIAKAQAKMRMPKIDKVKLPETEEYDKQKFPNGPEGE